MKRDRERDRVRAELENVLRDYPRMLSNPDLTLIATLIRYRRWNNSRYSLYFVNPFYQPVEDDFW